MSNIPDHGDPFEGPARLVSFQFNEGPWYPLDFNIPPDMRIVLHSNGTWEAHPSLEAIRQKMASNKNLLADPSVRGLLWLIMRQMELDTRTW